MGETHFQFRTIGELADLCGAYCWLEHRLFELTGSWASAPADPAAPTDPAAPAAPSAPTDFPEARVFFSEASAQHALLATQWRERLPVRAGVDPDALVVPPAGPAGPVAEALCLLSDQPGTLARLAGLVEVVLPRLLSTYEDHLERSSPVSEAPVRAVLELACFRTPARIALGKAVLHRGWSAQGTDPDEGGAASEFAQNVHDLFGGNSGIFPAARAS